MCVCFFAKMNETALMLAINQGRSTIVELLIKAGADLYAQNKVISLVTSLCGFVSYSTNCAVHFDCLCSVERRRL
jgi:ankyrin repeat protein